ncbi:HutD family protein [Dyella soli]|uniref:HutD family protein n=1 Tax=Dyella soli TaxID=522319 RepID=A0A4R0YZ54_9GAMM|nr:HutD family protein [Dyella soli]TCI10854.1 hypothetical protein EZM97_18595 [Dyella soli]
MSQLLRLPPEMLHTRPLPEGGAIITEIASGPANGDWQWQLTMVSIGQDVAFPTHADIRRQFVPLDAAVEVTFADGRTQQLNRLQMAGFDRANDPETCIPAAATRAFNLKLKDGVQGELIARPLNGAMVLVAPQGWRWFVLLLSGGANVIADHRSQVMSPDDMLWIDPIPGHPVRIEGGGELVLARVPAH